MLQDIYMVESQDYKKIWTEKYSFHDCFLFHPRVNLFLPVRCFWFFKVSFIFILPLFLICVHVCIPSRFFWPCISGGHPCSFFYSSITFHCVWVPEFSNQSNTDGHLNCSQPWLLQIMLQSVCHFAILVVRFGIDFWNCDCWVKGKRHVQCC